MSTIDDVSEETKFHRERFFSVAEAEGETSKDATAAMAALPGQSGAETNNTSSRSAATNQKLADLLRMRLPESETAQDEKPCVTKEDITDAICGLLYRVLKSEQSQQIGDGCAVLPSEQDQNGLPREAVDTSTSLLELLRLLCKFEDIPAATRLSTANDVADGICALLSEWIYEEGGFGVFSEHFEVLGCRDSGEGNNAIIKFAVLRPKLPALEWAVFVVFRGTLTKEDWLRDISCWPMTDVMSGIRAHQGMLAAAQDCYDSWASRGLRGVHQILSELPAVQGGAVTVYMTGHSLGGGVALATKLLTRSRPIQGQSNAFSFHAVTFGSPLVFQSASESPDHFARAEIEANLSALHAGARNYVSCHDLIPRILCCRGEQLERLKRMLVDAGKEHAKSSAWAIWMVVEGRAEQAISGVIEGIMNILRSVSRQGEYIMVGQLMAVCSPKACFLKDPGADLYRYRMDSPWAHIAPDELVQSAFLPPEWLTAIPEHTNIKRAVKGHSMAGYTESILGIRPPWLKEIIALDNSSHEPAPVAQDSMFLTSFFTMGPAVARNLRSLELVAAATQLAPAYEFDDTCNALLVEAAMNFNAVRRLLRNDSAGVEAEQLIEVATKILEIEKRNSSELLSALSSEQRDVLDRNRRVGMQVVTAIETAKKNANPGAVIMAMSSRRSNPGVMAKGAYALVSLADGNKTKMKELLEKVGPGSDGGAAAVTEWLSAMLSIIQTQQSKVGSGAIREAVGLVVEAMRGCAQHSVAQAHGCAVIASIALNAECHPRLVAENCIGALVLAMGQHRQDPAVQEKAVTALCRLAGAENEEVRERIGAEGGIAAVVEAMKWHGELEGVQEQGCLTLCLLADQRECAASMQIENSGVRDVVAGAFRHIGSARVQEHGAELNGRLGLGLSPAELANSAIAAGKRRHDAAAVLRAMREQTFQVNVQRHGFEALAAILATEEGGAASDPPREAAGSGQAGAGGEQSVEARAVRAVVEGMAQHLASAPAQRDGCEALRRLVGRDGLCGQVGQLGGVAAVVNAMRAHPTLAELQELACSALVDLCTDCAENESLKQDLGGIEAAVEAMRTHGGNRGVVEKASLVMGWGGLGDVSRTPTADSRGESVGEHGADFAEKAEDTHE